MTEKNSLQMTKKAMKILLLMTKKTKRVVKICVRMTKKVNKLFWRNLFNYPG